MSRGLYTSLFIVFTSLGLASPVQANVEEALANICTIVQADDKGELRKKMRTVQSNYKLKLRDYYDGVTCGGNSLIRTAILSDAIETGTMMVKKMSTKSLGMPEHDGKTLSVWIAEKGLSAHPISSVLQNRL